MSEVCDRAIAILKNTNDGDDLSPLHLSIVEYAVNGHLNERGMEVFNTIHADVMAGTYKKSWFHGIEHLTNDHEGYVYWKGQHVEHYSFSDYEREEQAALELARRCRILEEEGQPVNSTTAIWKWDRE